jgi:hypothetical protein
MAFLVKNGLAQKNPFSLTVPLYFPNRVITLELLGLMKKKPVETSRAKNRIEPGIAGCQTLTIPNIPRVRSPKKSNLKRV